MAISGGLAIAALFTHNYGAHSRTASDSSLAWRVKIRQRRQGCEDIWRSTLKQEISEAASGASIITIALSSIPSTDNLAERTRHPEITENVALKS